jgi:magnesium-transporting ATPase (P-type)
MRQRGSALRCAPFVWAVHFAEGIGILVAVLLATGLAFLNEYRAAKAFDILNRSSDDASVTVRRDDNYTTIPRRDVVEVEGGRVEVGQAGRVAIVGVFAQQHGGTVGQGG